jgi:hypothetical protein
MTNITILPEYGYIKESVRRRGHLLPPKISFIRRATNGTMKKYKIHKLQEIKKNTL